ncbi:hypothetical protein MJN54_33180, partial [Salmonella enterica subsp. enterica serovar Kentucky]|nr:hypothetical protein [Salmonella enterica subsp. enterica serovar Kentucky]
MTAKDRAQTENEEKIATQVLLLSFGIHDWSGGTYLRRIYPFMKQPEEELQETLTELDDRAVVDYLRH